MTSDYELIYLHNIEAGNWIKTPNSDRPVLVLKRQGRAFCVAVFDEKGIPTSERFDVDWDMEQAPIARLANACMHLGDVDPVTLGSGEWPSPFALACYAPFRDAAEICEPMVKVVLGVMQDPMFHGLHTNTGRSFSPSYCAFVRDFCLWASPEAMARNEDPLIHCKR